MYVPCLYFKTPNSSHVLRRKPCPCRYFTILFGFVFFTVGVSIHLCCLLPFHLSYVTVSRPCHLSEFTLMGPVLIDYEWPLFFSGSVKN